LKTVKTWGVVAITTAVLIVISVNFFDRPIALFSYQAFGHLMIVRQFAATPSFFGPLEVFVLLIFLVRRVALYPLERPDVMLISCEASLLLTNVLVLPLKFMFGRTWPLYGHRSLLIDGAYSFFTAGQYAFPSGHMASVCALACILWTTYPRFKPLYAVGVAAVAIALVAGDFHFVSDVLAGGFLGITVGTVILAASDFVKMRLLYIREQSMDRLQQRLADLEKALAPKGRHFVFTHFVDGEPDAPSRDKRLAVFKADHGITPATSSTK
jgi:membrane-associated phospholipid phosphatase